MFCSWPPRAKRPCSPHRITRIHQLLKPPLTRLGHRDRYVAIPPTTPAPLFVQSGYLRATADFAGFLPWRAAIRLLRDLGMFAPERVFPVADNFRHEGGRSTIAQDYRANR